MYMVQSGPARTSVLDEQLCFALYTASRAMAGTYRSMLQEAGLTYPQYLVMLVLWERGSALVTGIGRALQLDTGTLSPLLKRLEANGLINRARQDGDERAVQVTLTPAGRELEAQLADVQRRAAEATGMSRSEIVELRAALHRLSGQLRTAAAADARSA